MPLNYLETGTILKTLGYNVVNPIYSIDDLQYLDTTKNLSDIANEVLGNAINKLAKTYIDVAVYDTKFKRFLKDKIEFGNIIEDINVNVVRGKTWTNATTEGTSNLDYKAKPTIKVTYQNQSYKTIYEYSLEDSDIQKAFRNSTSLDAYLRSFFQAVVTGINVDMENFSIATLSLKDCYNSNMIVEIAKPVDATTSKAFMKKIEEYKDNFKHLSNAYNSIAHDTSTKPNELVMVVRDDIRRTLDYDFLSGVFNLSKVDLDLSILDIQAFGKSTSASDSTIVEDDTILAVLMDEDAFYIHPRYQENSIARNQRGRYANYYYHRDWVFGFRLGKNRVMFVTPSE